MNPLPRVRKLAAEECRTIGGHCWRDAPFEIVDAVIGGTRHRTETCKHCPATREGVSREPWEWTVAE